ncbi:MAG: hypothetical protein GY906_15560 [bacterium]|nr:hypothetical protein [bacterium]
MAIVTYLEAVNRVLVRMREGQVAAIGETEYSELVAAFVRQANSEIEDAHDWIDLRETVQLVTQEATFDYGLTGAGQGFRVLHVHEDTLDYTLRRARSYAWMNDKLLINDPDFSEPLYWDWNGRTSNGDPIINLWPIPDKPYQVNFNVIIKQVLDDDGKRIIVPDLPVVLRATQLALEERGDDGGPSAPSLGQQASSALADAVMYDINMYPADNVWEVV